LISLPFVLLFENQLFPTSLSGWVNIFSLSLLCQVIASVIFIYQLKQFSSGFVSFPTNNKLEINHGKTNNRRKSQLNFSASRKYK
jgi:hypothetical protein